MHYTRKKRGQTTTYDIKFWYDWVNQSHHRLYRIRRAKSIAAQIYIAKRATRARSSRKPAAGSSAVGRKESHEIQRRRCRAVNVFIHLRDIKWLPPVALSLSLLSRTDRARKGALQWIRALWDCIRIARARALLCRARFTCPREPLCYKALRNILRFFIVRRRHELYIHFNLWRSVWFTFFSRVFSPLYPLYSLFETLRVWQKVAYTVFISLRERERERGLCMLTIFYVRAGCAIRLFSCPMREV